ncbi:hypothetical protein SVI_2581 [Shewanella violacea DSS12]|uniref:Uncharacterized protein n=1 Tax=Shewanella violacea (strain JCM 10179 / CIP 106290 / LMG 19151 / DSS12) TaxID=637905 RepID=D4ZLK3_SHEVD|nr:hypothetical protein SVI_2581 [Shewanella violacea DSS12]
MSLLQGATKERLSLYDWKQKNTKISKGHDSKTVTSYRHKMIPVFSSQP